MSGRSIGAKLSGVHALSTILFALALPHPAGAQVFGASASHARPSWWLSVDAGRSERFSVSDEASSARWTLGESSPMRVALAYGRLERLIGVAMSHAAIPLLIVGTSCMGCSARVQALQALATYRSTQSLFTTAFTQTLEFGAGVTRWSGLTGRGGHTLPGIAANHDLTFVAGIGLGLPVGEWLELSVTYDIAAMTHEKQKNSVFGEVSSSKVSLPTLRAGARMHLDHQ